MPHATHCAIDAIASICNTVIDRMKAFYSRIWRQAASWPPPECNSGRPPPQIRTKHTLQPSQQPSTEMLMPNKQPSHEHSCPTSTAPTQPATGLLSDHPARVSKTNRGYSFMLRRCPPGSPPHAGLSSPTQAGSGGNGLPFSHSKNCFRKPACLCLHQPSCKVSRMHKQVLSPSCTVCRYLPPKLEDLPRCSNGHQPLPRSTRCIQGLAHKPASKPPNTQEAGHNPRPCA